MPYPVPPPPVPSVVQSLPEGIQPTAEINPSIATPLAVQQPESTHSLPGSPIAAASADIAPAALADVNAGVDGVLAGSLGNPVEVGVATSNPSAAPDFPPTEPQTSDFLSWSESDLTKLAQYPSLLPDNFASPDFSTVSTIPASALSELLNGSASFSAADAVPNLDQHSGSAGGQLLQSTGQPVAQQPQGDQPQQGQLQQGQPQQNPPTTNPVGSATGDSSPASADSAPSTQPVPPSAVSPTGATPETPPATNPASPSPAATPGNPQLPPIDQATTAQEVIELRADRQEYDERARVFRAQGNVELRFRGALLNSDRLQVNIPNRIAVADGNAALTRGQQILRGNRIEYNLVQNQGNVQQASGEISLATITTDFSPNQSTTLSPTTPVVVQPLSSVLTQQQPFQAAGSGGGLTFGANTPNQPGASSQLGQINRLRYEADEIQFQGNVWEATNVRITNDPFSPPELELRSSRVTVTPLTATQTEIRARNPRLVFDQGFTLPLLRDRVVIDSRQRSSGLFSFGYDEQDRGGLFIERPFELPIGNVSLLRLTPQILVQRALQEDGFGSLSSYGLIARLDVQPTPITSIVGNAVFTSLDPADFEDTFRGSIRAKQIFARHTFNLEYTYRNRLYNGSLGYQSVHSSGGLVITSPNIVLGSSQINLNYQAGIQLIDSDANGTRLNDPDVVDLLPPIDPLTGGRPNNRITLARYQGVASLSRFFFLWSGTPLPSTPEEGLRYTPTPVVPYVAMLLNGRGVLSGYSNGDYQSVFTGTAGLYAQFGHFSKPFLDYTGINVSYSYNAIGGETPFDFDRINDIQVLNVGLTQQIVGPLRAGFRSSFYLQSLDLNRNDTSDTTFFVEYSRRTYSITLSYSPNREAGSINFRVNDFNWTGTPDPFSGLKPSSEPGTE